MGKITIRLPPTRDQLLAAAKKAMEAVNTVAVSTIVRRTAAGSSAGGGPFPGYTPEYRRRKASTGRSVGHVDLTLSGQMLANLKPKGVKIDDRGPVGIIGFEGQHRTVRFGRQSSKAFVSDLATRKTSGKRTLHRSDAGGGVSSVPMAAVVLGLSRKYDFFSIRAPAEIGRLVSTFQRVMAAEIRRLTQ